MTTREFVRFGFRNGVTLNAVLIMLGLNVASYISEAAGLGILFPIAQYMMANGDIAKLSAESGIWTRIVGAYGWLGLPVTLVTLLATSLIFILLRQVFVYARMFYSYFLSNNVTARIRARGLSAFIRADAAYQDSAPAGEIVNRLTVEVQYAVGCLMQPFSMMTPLTMAAIYLAILFAISFTMTVALIGSVAIALLAMHWFTRSTMVTSRSIVQANNEIGDFLVQRLKLARLIRLSGTEGAEIDAMTRLTRTQATRNMQAGRLNILTEVIVEPIVVAAGFTLLVFGTEVLGLGLVAIGAFLVVVLRILPVVKSLVGQRQTLMQYSGSLESVDRLIAELEAVTEPPGGPLQFERLTRGIRLERIAFTYPGREQRSLDDITVEIPAASLTALVGPSGAGKSTLIDLLPRIRHPGQGRILLDDMPLSDFSIQSLRAGIAFLPQRSEIFNVTVAEHIRYGKPDATLPEIEAAAALAGAAEFIRDLPQGYDTLLGEDGDRLSGGQRQRLDLARALIRRAPILILDEPTANLDVDSETAFQAALGRIRRETRTTIIVIGHRLSTVAQADRIIVLTEGRIVEQGTHMELVEKDGWYAQAFARQHQNLGTPPSRTLAAVARER